MGSITRSGAQPLMPEQVGAPARRTQNDGLQRKKAPKRAGRKRK